MRNEERGESDVCYCERFSDVRAVYISNEKDSYERSHHAWIVPVQFRPPPFANDFWHLEGDMASGTVQVSNGRQTDVKFVQNLLFYSSLDLRRRDVVYVRILGHCSILRRERNCFYIMGLHTTF